MKSWLRKHRLRQKHFRHKNKFGKYLVNQIKRNKEKTTISIIKDSAGKPTPTYTHQKKTCDLPQLSREQTNKTDSLLPQDELYTVLILMPSNKAPGPDGFPAEFYKHFWPLLASLFNRLITKIKQIQEYQ